MCPFWLLSSFSSEIFWNLPFFGVIIGVAFVDAATSASADSMLFIVVVVNAASMLFIVVVVAVVIFSTFCSISIACIM